MTSQNTSFSSITVCSYIIYIYIYLDKMMFATCKYINICKIKISSSFSSRLPCLFLSLSPWDDNLVIVCYCHFCFFSIITVHIIVIITTMIITDMARCNDGCSFRPNDREKLDINGAYAKLHTENHIKSYKFN